MAKPKAKPDSILEVEVFLRGHAGTGKSLLLNKIARILMADNFTIRITEELTAHVLRGFKWQNLE